MRQRKTSRQHSIVDDTLTDTGEVDVLLIHILQITTKMAVMQIIFRPLQGNRSKSDFAVHTRALPGKDSVRVRFTR